MIFKTVKHKMRVWQYYPKNGALTGNKSYARVLITTWWFLIIPIYTSQEIVYINLDG